MVSKNLALGGLKVHCIWANLTQPNFGPWVWVWLKSKLMVSKNLALHGGKEAVEAVGWPQRKLIVCKSVLHLNNPILDPGAKP